jgi:hypothetical protein
MGKKKAWKINIRDSELLISLLNKCIRKLMKIFWPVKITNRDFREFAGMEKISTIIRIRR